MKPLLIALALIAQISFAQELQKQGLVSVKYDGHSTTMASEVFASGELLKAPDGSFVANLFVPQTTDIVAKYYYQRFDDYLTRREFFDQGLEYLHLPLYTGDTIYRHTEFLYGRKGNYSLSKLPYENWSPKERANEYGLVTVLDGGLTRIVWYDRKSGNIRADYTYRALYPSNVKLQGTQIKYHKSTGEVFSEINYDNDNKTWAKYYDTQGRLERSYTYNAAGGYELEHYYAAESAEQGRLILKRHEVLAKKGDKVKGELYGIDGKKQKKFTPFIVDPQFPGGPDKLKAFLKKNLRYPEAARQYQVQGRVVLQFFVETDGTLSEIKVLSTPHELLTQEAIRVLQKMPKWKPGLQDGTPKRVKAKQPFIFYMN